MFSGLKKIKQDMDVYSTSHPGEVDVPQVADILSLGSLVNSKTKHKHFSDSHRWKHFLGVRALQQTRRRAKLRKRTYEKVNREEFMKALSGINARKGGLGRSELDSDKLQKYHEAVRSARMALANSQLKVSGDAIAARRKTLRELHGRLHSKKAELQHSHAERAKKQKFKDEFYDLLLSSRSLLPKPQFDALHRAMSPGRSSAATTARSSTTLSPHSEVHRLRGGSSSHFAPPVNSSEHIKRPGGGPHWSPLNSNEALSFGRLNTQAGVLSRLADEVNDDLHELELFTDKQLEESAAASARFEEALRGLEAGIDSLDQPADAALPSGGPLAEGQAASNTDPTPSAESSAGPIPPQVKSKDDFMVGREQPPLPTTYDPVPPPPGSPTSHLSYIPEIVHDGDDAGDSSDTERSIANLRDLYDKAATPTETNRSTFDSMEVDEWTETEVAGSAQGASRPLRLKPLPYRRPPTRQPEGRSREEPAQSHLTVETYHGESVPGLIGAVHDPEPTAPAATAVAPGEEFAEGAHVFYTDRKVFVCRIHRHHEEMDFLALDKDVLSESLSKPDFSLQDSISVSYDPRFLRAMPDLSRATSPEEALSEFSKKAPSSWQYNEGLGLTYICSPYVAFMDGGMDWATLAKLYRLFKWPAPPFATSTVTIDSEKWQSKSSAVDLVLLFPVSISAEVKLLPMQGRRVWTVQPLDSTLVTPLLFDQHPNEQFRRDEQTALQAPPAPVQHSPPVLSSFAGKSEEIEQRPSLPAWHGLGDSSEKKDTLEPSNAGAPGLPQTMTYADSREFDRASEGEELEDDRGVLEAAASAESSAENDDTAASASSPQPSQALADQSAAPATALNYHSNDDDVHMKDENMAEEASSGPPIRTVQLPSVLFGRPLTSHQQFIADEVDQIILSSGEFVAPTLVQLSTHSAAVPWLKEWTPSQPMLQLSVDETDSRTIIQRLWLERNLPTLHRLFTLYDQWQEEQRRNQQVQRDILSKNAFDVIENAAYLERQFPISRLQGILSHFTSRIDQLIDSLVSSDPHHALVSLRNLHEVLSGQLQKHADARQSAYDRLTMPFGGAASSNDDSDGLTHTRDLLVERHNRYIATYEALLDRLHEASRSVLDQPGHDKDQEMSSDAHQPATGAHGRDPVSGQWPWSEQDLRQHRDHLAQSFVEATTASLDKSLGSTKTALPELLLKNAAYSKSISFSIPRKGLRASTATGILRKEFAQHFLNPAEQGIGTDLLDDRLALLNTGREPTLFFTSEGSHSMDTGDSSSVVEEESGMLVVSPGFYHGHQHLQHALRFDVSRYDRGEIDGSHPLSSHPAAVQSRLAAFPKATVQRTQLDELAAIETGLSVVALDENGLPLGFGELKPYLSTEFAQRMAELSDVLAKPKLCMLHREKVKFDFSSVADDPAANDRKQEEYAFKLLLHSSHALQLYAAWLLGLNSTALSPHGSVYYLTVTHLTSSLLINGLEWANLDVQMVSDVCSYAVAFPQDTMQALYGRDCLLHIATAVNGRMKTSERYSLNSRMVFESNIPALQTYLTSMATFNSVVRYETVASPAAQRMHYVAELNVLYALRKANYHLTNVSREDLAAISLHDAEAGADEEDAAAKGEMMSDLTAGEAEDEAEWTGGTQAQAKKPSKARLRAAQPTGADLYRPFTGLLPTGWSAHRQQEQRESEQRAKEEERIQREVVRESGRLAKQQREEERRRRMFALEQQRARDEEVQRRAVRIQADTSTTVLRIFSKLANAFRKNRQVSELRQLLLLEGYEQFRSRFAADKKGLHSEELNRDWLLRFFNVYLFRGQVIQRCLALTLPDKPPTGQGGGPFIGLLEITLLSCTPNEVRDGTRTVELLHSSLIGRPKIFQPAYLDIFWRSVNTLLDPQQAILPGTFSLEDFRLRVAALKQVDLQDLLSRYDGFSSAFVSGLTDAEWRMQVSSSGLATSPEAARQEGREAQGRDVEMEISTPRPATPAQQ